ALDARGHQGHGHRTAVGPPRCHMPRHRDESTREREGQRVRGLRELFGWSQSQVAREFGVATAAVSHWEAGERTVPGPVLRLIDLYEEELGYAPSAERTVQMPTTAWAARTAGTAAALSAWLAARALVPPAAGGVLGRRLREWAIERYVTS